MENSKNWKEKILADGEIDEAEVKELKSALFADGKIDREEADFLFDLNNAVSGKNNHESWEELFIQAISGYLLDDDNSAGEIDAAEAEWLYGKLSEDGHVDTIERKLLLHLRERSGNFPAHLESLLQ